MHSLKFAMVAIASLVFLSPLGMVRQPLDAGWEAKMFGRAKDGRV